MDLLPPGQKSRDVGLGRFLSHPWIATAAAAATHGVQQGVLTWGNCYIGLDLMTAVQSLHIPQPSVFWHSILPAWGFQPMWLGPGYGPGRSWCGAQPAAPLGNPSVALDACSNALGRTKRQKAIATSVAPVCTGSLLARGAAATSWPLCQLWHI